MPPTRLTRARSSLTCPTFPISKSITAPLSHKYHAGAMTSQYPSSFASTVPPTFYKDGVPHQLVDFLKSVGDELLDPALVTQQAEWRQLVYDLLRCFCIEHSSSHPWEALHEAVGTLERAFQYVLHAIHRVPGIFEKEETLAQAVFARATIVANALALWIDVDPPPQEGYATPVELYNAAKATSVATLRYLSTEKNAQVVDLHWRIMHELVAHCIKLVDGSSHPLVIFRTPTYSIRRRNHILLWGD